MVKTLLIGAAMSAAIAIQAGSAAAESHTRHGYGVGKGFIDRQAYQARKARGRNDWRYSYPYGYTGKMSYGGRQMLILQNPHNNGSSIIFF